MKRRQRGSWWGLYALAPATAILLYLAAVAKVGKTVHEVLYATVAVVVALLALLWSEKHADLIGSEGVNAQAEQDSLLGAGIKAGRFAPSLTARQAHYRRTMLAGAIHRFQDGNEPPSFDVIRHFSDDDPRLEQQGHTQD